MRRHDLSDEQCALLAPCFRHPARPDVHGLSIGACSMACCGTCILAPNGVTFLSGMVRGKPSMIAMSVGGATAPGSASSIEL